MRTTRIHQQLNDARLRSKLTIRELAKRSGLSLDHSLLIRKLSGKVPMKTEEAEVLTDTLRRAGVAITISWPKRAA